MGLLGLDAKFIQSVNEDSKINYYFYLSSSSQNNKHFCTLFHLLQ